MIELRTDYSSSEFSREYPQESAEVEFKTGIGPEPIQAAAVALSNTHGGVILLGVSDSGEVLGRQLDQTTEEKINAAILDAYAPGRYAIREIRIEGRTVVAILVHPRQEGFSQTSQGRTLVRRGPRNHALIGSELQDFINARSHRRFEQTPTPLALSDIDPSLLSEFGSALSWPTDGAVVGDRLRERGLSDGHNLTIAGALLLTYPADSLRLAKAVVEVRRYPAEGVNYDRREAFGGPLHHQVREASKFITDELGSELIVSGLYRYDLPKLPEVVIREAVANGVAHRSYEDDRTPVIVEIRPDRVTVRSPGSLPEPVTVETIRVAQAARNPSIIDALRVYGLAEDAGRGIDVIQDTMRDALLDPPVFEDDGSFVTVTLPLHGPITARERGWIQDLERKGSIASEDRLLIVHAARGEALTNATAREILGKLDQATARRSLQRLRDVGLLTQVGARRSTRYELTESLAPPASFRMSQREVSEIVVAAAGEGPISNATVRELTGLGRAQAVRLLRDLVRDNRLEKIGEKRGTRYVAR